MRGASAICAASAAWLCFGTAAGQERADGPQATAPITKVDAIPLVQWDFQRLYVDGWRANDLIDAEVYGAQGETIGSVEDLVLDRSGSLVSIIAEVGGLWDIGDTHVSIPWDRAQITPGAEGLRVPITAENTEDFVPAADGTLAADELRERQVTIAEGIKTGPRIWRMTELISDLVRLDDQDGYGKVDDALFDSDGKLQAVIVRPHTSYGVPRSYAFPFHGYGANWSSDSGFYDLPYGRAEVENQEKQQDERMESQSSADR